MQKEVFIVCKSRNVKEQVMFTNKLRYDVFLSHVYIMDKVRFRKNRLRTYVYTSDKVFQNALNCARYWAK